MFWVITKNSFFISGQYLGAEFERCHQNVKKKTALVVETVMNKPG